MYGGIIGGRNVLPNRPGGQQQPGQLNSRGLTFFREYE